MFDEIERIGFWNDIDLEIKNLINKEELLTEIIEINDKIIENIK